MNPQAEAHQVYYLYLYVQPIHNSHFHIVLNYSHIPGIGKMLVPLGWYP